MQGSPLLQARGDSRERVQRIHRGHPLDVEGADFIEDAFVAWREQTELRRRSGGAPITRDSRHSGFIQFALLEVGKNFPRAADDRIRDSRQPRHLDTVTSRRRLLDNAAQENYLGAPFAHRHAQVLDPRTLAREVGQFVEVGCEQHLGSRLIVQVLGDGPQRKGDANPYTSLNGNMFTLLQGSRSLAIRLPEDKRAEFLKKHKTTLFEAYGAVMKEYIAVPDALLKNTKELQKYLECSYEYAKTLKPKPTKKPKKEKE